MDRREALKHIGKQVRIIDSINGIYLGELLDIICEPRKPWRGKVKIVAIEKYPTQDPNSLAKLRSPCYQDGEVYEILGSKIELTLEEVIIDFKGSLIRGLKNEIAKFKEDKNKINSILHELQKELKDVLPSDTYEDVDKESGSEYQYYTIKEDDGNIYLYDDLNTKVPLENCPFEFEFYKTGNWHTIRHENSLIFKNKSGQKIKLNLGDIIRLNKDQFDPYQLLINELESPALDSLNKGLQDFQFTHKDCVNCQNTLLTQYLSTENETNFKGVNFISYQKENKTLIIQHHFEREIIEGSEDLTYDRFEFTDETGKRLLMTYTTQTPK